MARSIKKGPYVEANLEEKCLASTKEKKRKVLSKHGAAVQRSLLIL